MYCHRKFSARLKDLWKKKHLLRRNRHSRKYLSLKMHLYKNLKFLKKRRLSRT